MSSQKELEDIVSWYAKPLRLHGYRFDVQWDQDGEHIEDHAANGELWTSSNYPIAIIRVRPANPTDTWPHDMIEEVAVHELIHIITKPLRDAYLDLLNEIDLTNTARNLLFLNFERAEERAVETFALAFVSVAHADRNGPAPSSGGIVKREEEAA